MNTVFTGKKLLVVGGTSGMGLATAKRVIENGGSVVLVGNRQEKAEQARQITEAFCTVDRIGRIAGIKDHVADVGQLGTEIAPCLAIENRIVVD